MSLPEVSSACRSSSRYARKPDHDLIAACLSGDVTAWDTLIDRYKGLVYMLARRMGLSDADASDVLQEVSLLLVSHLSDLRDVTKLTPWLAITTKREAWRRLRQQEAAITIETIEYDAADEENGLKSKAAGLPTPEESLLALEDQALVRQALSSLPDRCRNLLTLLYCEEPPCSYAETASRLGIAMNSMGPNRLRCLQHLKKTLDAIGF
ncbi:MAG TPA: sigma-70 family RNA polymerase sigma factor [Chthonomonadaceae bacterium]|nr:sigma-70 family RNA polymerase sigma factor [Chthonomonadaceae bacterium]